MNTKLDRDTREHYRVEYQEVSSNLRHYSNLRFTIFTVFLAFQAGLIGFGLNPNSPISSTLSIVVKIAGIIATFVFWTYTERVTAYRTLFQNRASELETKLHFHQYLSRPKPMLGFLSTSFATRLFFFAVTAFWIVLSS